MGRLPLILSTLGCLLLPVLAPAQGPGPYVRPQMANPYARPVFSPYLNLLNPNLNPAINYYGLVRPEIEFRSSLQQLQQQVNTLPTTPSAPELAGIPVTGHTTQFLNYSHYYPSNLPGQSAGAAGRRPTGPQAVPTQPTVAAPASGGQPPRPR
jgi:hypothetical protein